MPSFEEQYDSQFKLIYSLVVAGKSADFADKATRSLIHLVAAKSGNQTVKILPLDMFRSLTPEARMECVKESRCGNYSKLSKAISELIERNLDLETCSPTELETVHGFGPKTSRFFIIWTRPHEQYAALDVHVLRWLKALGHNVPKSTPQSTAAYSRIEQIFLKEAATRNKTARQLDEEIWAAGAGR